jgi:hypothetical protein
VAITVVPSTPQGLATTDSPTFAALTLTNPLVPASGGTGHAVYVVGDLLQADTTTTLARLAAPSAGKFIRAAGVGVMFAWSTLVLPNAATAFRLPVATAADTIGELAASGAAGEYLAGVTGAVPAWATLNQAAVAGLTTASTPTFVSVLLSGLTASVPVVTDGSKNLASQTYASFKASLVIAQADVAGLTTASSPTFNALTLTTNLGAGGAAAARVWIKQSANSVAGGLRSVRSDAANFLDLYIGGDNAIYLQNNGGADAYVSLGSAGQFVVGTAGPHAIGGAVSVNDQITLKGAFTGSALTRGFTMTSDLTGIAGADIKGAQFNPNLIEAGSGVHAVVVGFEVIPGITAGAATVTDAIGARFREFAAATGTTSASTVKIEDAPTGATNMYALWVVTGGVRLGGLGAFVAGDKYVIADANGNLHVSALGPAS